ncbi:hypothetical protein TA3x_004233 [Tundrisphaera sp. TA3]|uniref:hypothetical protein n=1 Tax=Tundrisphaera sp. TA3 TaxID=3435775 RepID=UPI003EBAF7C7
MTSLLRPWIFATLALAAFAAPGAPAVAQDPGTPAPKDQSLDDLLKKLDEPRPAEPAKEPEKEKPKDADKPREKDKPKDAKAEDKGKPAGTVAPQDESLDSLLEKLGTTVDKPRADEKPPAGGGGMPPDDQPPPPGDPSKKPDPLEGESQKLDEHLRELTGKRDTSKKKQQQGQGQGQSQEGGEQGPLDQVIREMRDVEERLGQPDTGEGTRQKQAEIVKNLDTLIEQMNQAKSQSQAMKMLRQGQKPGQGQQQGQQQGAQANGPPPSRPASPKGQAPIALDKDVWGQLPAALREEMGNVFKEGPLPNKLDLIRQYYLSLGKKTTAREE